MGAAQEGLYSVMELIKARAGAHSRPPFPLDGSLRMPHGWAHCSHLPPSERALSLLTRDSSL